jgi:hypothetical protein
MLLIRESHRERWHNWHVGESFPELRGRVITFQADRQELDFLLDAIKSALPDLGDWEVEGGA